MPTALFISPHLDDVAFSCGGTLLRLRDRGWRIVMCTIFTQSVPDPQGFALACQTDKGLSPDVDYMAIRRDEDRVFGAIAHADLIHLPLPEAPHRGYHSAAELFGGVHDGDEIWRDLVEEIRDLVVDLAPDAIFAPQGLGNHADHLQVIRAIIAAGLEDRVLWYRDTPYAIRQPDALPSSLLPDGLIERGVRIDRVLDRKIEGCCAYATQVGFQFGGSDQVRSKLTAFHRAEARRMGIDGAAEALLISPTLPLNRWLDD
jgi:LmbE family N-acetylglucosaminyl deacetylase